MYRAIAVLVIILFIVTTIFESKKDSSDNLIQKIFDFLAKIEGVQKTGYIDSSGRWHTGLGHLILENEKYLRTKVLTKSEIYDLFVKDYLKFKSEFEQAQKVFEQKMSRKMSQNEKIAYFSFGYNLGFDDIRRLFSGNYLNLLKTNRAEAKKMLESYSLVNGVRDASIKKRRGIEFEFMY